MTTPRTEGMAYYNEIEPYAAEWLRNLIKAGHIAPGDVDTRSIEDVSPIDLVGYSQCHFFAGLGGWSYALRLAGWPDNRPVWTGSCPCQPFSAAGKGKGFSDERHLWPAWFHLISECKPGVIFGEQVASPDGLKWLELVHADLEAEDYACGAFDLCAAGVGAPELRQRLWIVANASGERCDGERLRLLTRESQQDHAEAGRSREAGGLANGTQERRERSGLARGRRDGSAHGGIIGQLGNSELEGSRRDTRAIPRAQKETQGRMRGKPDRLESSSPVGGFWSNAEWLWHRDEKYRPVEPGSFPLAHGVPNRVGRIRAYGNAIVPQVAAEVIGAYMECVA